MVTGGPGPRPYGTGIIKKKNTIAPHGMTHTRACSSRPIYYARGFETAGRGRARGRGRHWDEYAGTFRVLPFRFSSVYVGLITNKTVSSGYK